MPEPYYEDDVVTLYHGDCREVPLAGDALVTDPPFNVGKDYGTSSDDLAADEYADLMRHVSDNGPDLQAWVTPTNRLSLFSGLLGLEARPVVIRRGAKGPKRWGWYDQFDMVLVRGKPREYVTNLWDDIRLKGEGYYFREESYEHPGFTPYPIMARLARLMLAPGQTLVEPFAGTGTALVAAKALGLKAVGVELDEKWCELAASRLSQAVLDVWGEEASANAA